MKYQLLAETALLTHGLTTISNDKLRERFPENFSGLVWVDQGEIVTGNIDSFRNSLVKSKQKLIALKNEIRQKAPHPKG